MVPTWLRYLRQLGDFCTLQRSQTRQQHNTCMPAQAFHSYLLLIHFKNKLLSHMFGPSSSNESLM